MTDKLKKFVEIFKSEDIKSLINTLSGDDIRNILIDINREVRELGAEEGGIYKGDRMIVGECISPKGEIQEKYFDKISEFLKSINNKQDMAIGMYYLINYLHLFQDGNGRTSRFVYEIMANSDFQDFDGGFFRHEQGKDTSRAGFCKQKGIIEVVEAKRYSGYATYQYLSSMGLLPDNLKEKNLYWAHTYVPSEFDEIYISEQAINEGILASEVRIS